MFKILYGLTPARLSNTVAHAINSNYNLRNSTQKVALPLHKSDFLQFTALSMDWTTPGDLHKRLKIFKVKCHLIFDSPLANKAEDKKARLLLLWAGDKGLEIYIIQLHGHVTRTQSN